MDVHTDVHSLKGDRSISVPERHEFDQDAKLEMTLYIINQRLTD